VSGPGIAAYFLRTPDGQLLSERTSSGTYYYPSDALGSVMALTNSTGAVVNTYAYDPYGASTASSGSTANVFGSGGQQLDSGAGLYKMGQRYYDPVLARWSSQDLLAGGLDNPQSFNNYSSVLGNPVSLLDATGLCWVCSCNFLCGAGGALHQAIENPPPVALPSCAQEGAFLSVLALSLALTGAGAIVAIPTAAAGATADVLALAGVC